MGRQQNNASPVFRLYVKGAAVTVRFSEEESEDVKGGGRDILTGHMENASLDFTIVYQSMAEHSAVNRSVVGLSPARGANPANFVLRDFCNSRADNTPTEQREDKSKGQHISLCSGWLYDIILVMLVATNRELWSVQYGISNSDVYKG